MIKRAHMSCKTLASGSGNRDCGVEDLKVELLGVVARVVEVLEVAHDHLKAEQLREDRRSELPVFARK